MTLPYSIIPLHSFSPLWRSTMAYILAFSIYICSFVLLPINFSNIKKKKKNIKSSGGVGFSFSFSF